MLITNGEQNFRNIDTAKKTRDDWSRVRMKTQAFENSGCINQHPGKRTQFQKLNFKPCKRNLKKLLKSYLIANVIP